MNIVMMMDDYIHDDDHHHMDDAVRHHNGGEGNVAVTMDGIRSVIDEDDDEEPLPLDHHHDPDDGILLLDPPEMSIFWTRATATTATHGHPPGDEFTPHELQEMFGYYAHSLSSSSSALPSAATTPSTTSSAAAGATTTKITSNNHDCEDEDMRMEEDTDEEEDSIMIPLEDKDGLLPPHHHHPHHYSLEMVEEEDEDDDEDHTNLLHYHQHVANTTTAHEPSFHQSKKTSFSTFLPQLNSSSMGTHTTVDLFDDGETYSTSAHVWGDDDEDLVYDEEHDTFEYDDEDDDNVDGHVITNTTAGNNRVMDPNWFERQQELLQEVVLLKPKQRPPLPHPTDRQKAVLKQVKAMTSTILPSPRKKSACPSPANTSATSMTTETTGTIMTTAATESPSTTNEDMDDFDENDPIFRRQREIFQQMREEERIQQERQQHQHHHLYQSHYPHHHDYQSHHPSTMKSPSSSSKPSIMSFQSPVSVVAPSVYTGTKSSPGSPGGAPSDDFPTMVAQWTNHTLLERQGDVLRESMKRSLETRQALHIRPTALPEYDHEHLTKILHEIESSSHKIRQTYLQQQRQQELQLQRQQEQDKAAVASSP